MAGFGRSPFGRGPFGRSSTGTDLIIQRFPTSYFDDSIVLGPGESPTDNNKDPLLFLLKTYANSVFLRRLDIDSMPTLIDFELAPLEIVRLTGDMLGIAIDKNDPEFLQRSLLGSASQWLQIKSSKQGYSVRGLASGFSVRVDNFWRIDTIYASVIPARFLYFLKPPEADPTAVEILHTDQPPGTFIGTPIVEDQTYAKSAYVRLVFQIVEPRIPLIDYNTLLDLVISKIKDVVGIHHELQAPQLLTIMNIPVPITVTMIIEEFAIFQASECFYYDITAADEVMTDVCFPTVNIIPGVGFVWQINPVITCTIEEDETDDSEITVPIQAPITVNIFQIQEQDEIPIVPPVTAQIVLIEESWFFEIVDVDITVEIHEEGTFSIDVNPTASLIAEDTSYFQAEEFYHFDITPADVVILDSAGNVFISTTQENQFQIYTTTFVDLAGHGTSEEITFIIDPATFSVKELDEQSIVNTPVNIGVEVLIPIVLDIPFTATFSFSEQEQSIVSSSLTLSSQATSFEVTTIPFTVSTEVVLIVSDEEKETINVSAPTSSNSQNFEVASASINVNLSILFSIPVSLDLFVAATVTTQIQEVDYFTDPVSASVTLQIFEAFTSNSFESVSISEQFSEQASINAFETMTASMQEVDAVMDIFVSGSASIIVDIDEVESVILVETEVVLEQALELADLTASLALSSSISRIDSVLNANVTPSVSIAVDIDEVEALVAVEAETAIVDSFESSQWNITEIVSSTITQIDSVLNVMVSTSVSIVVDAFETESIVIVEVETSFENAFELAQINISEPTTAVIQVIDAMADINVNLSAAIAIVASETDNFALVESEAVLENIFEGSTWNITEFMTATIEKVDTTLTASLSSSVTISIIDSEFEAIAITELGVLTEINAEFSSIVIVDPDSVSEQFDEFWSTSISESLNISSSLAELANIGVTFAGSVTMTSTIDGWTTNVSTSINATPNINEVSIGKNYGNNTALGWLVDAFPFYDDTSADVQTTDAHGFVTMTIQIGP